MAWIRPSAKERDKFKAEIQKLKEENKVLNLEKDRMLIDVELQMNRIKTVMTKIQAWEKWRKKINPKGNQMEFSSNMYIYLSLLIANIFLNVLFPGVWSLFNIVMLFIYFAYTQKVINTHNIYTIKKGDYRIRGKQK